MSETNENKITYNEHAMFQLVQNVAQLRQKLIEELMAPRRDIGLECGYPKNPNVHNDFGPMYDREGVGSRVVELYPEESWQKNPEVFEDDDEGVETPFEKMLKKLQQKHNLWAMLKRADILSGIGSFGVVLFGFDDLKEGDTLLKPVKGIAEDWTGIEWEDLEEDEVDEVEDEVEDEEPTLNADEPPVEVEEEVQEPTRKLLFLRTFDERSVKIKTWQTETSSPRYGQPLTYEIDLTDPAGSQSVQTMPTKMTEVHWTRILHLADNRTTSEVIGTPRQKPVFNYVYNCQKILGAGGEGYWKSGFPGLSIESQGNTEGVEFDLDATRAQAFDFMNGQNKYLGLIGMTAKSIAPNLIDPTPHFNIQVTGICIKLACPVRIFMGSERGELASSQDNKSWRDRMGSRRTDYIEPYILRPFVERCIVAGVLPMPKKIETHWPDTNAPSDKERADTALVWTQALSAYILGDLAAMVTPMDYLVKFFGLSQEEVMAMLESTVEEMGKTADPEDPEGMLGRTSKMPGAAEIAMRDMTPEQQIDMQAKAAQANAPPGAGKPPAKK